MGKSNKRVGFWKLFALSADFYGTHFKFIFIPQLLIALCFFGASRLTSPLYNPESYSYFIVRKIHFESLLGFLAPLLIIVSVKELSGKQTLSWKHLLGATKPLLLPAFLIHLIFFSLLLVKHLVELNLASEPNFEMAYIRVGLAILSAVILMYFIFHLEALVFHGQKNISAFKHSFRVVTGSWWKLFAVQAIFLLPGLISSKALTYSIARTSNLHLFEYTQYLFPIETLYTGYVHVFYALFYLNSVQHNARFKYLQR